MSILIYDVDVCVIKANDDDGGPLVDDEHIVVRGPSRRVVIRNEQQDSHSIPTRMTGVNLI